MLIEIFAGSFVMNHVVSAVSTASDRATDVAKERTDPKRWVAEYIKFMINNVI